MNDVGKLRPLAFLCAVLSLSSAYCHRYVGGIGTVSPVSPDGATCNDNVECASYNCAGGQCVAPPAGTAEIDGDCSSGQACVGDATCQDGICVAGGMAACAADGQPCETDQNCCTQICTSNRCGFDTTGTGGSSTTSGTNCASEGGSCSIDSDCCTGACDTNVFQCSNSCGTSGANCFDGTDCCSSVCSSGDETCI